MSNNKQSMKKVLEFLGNVISKFLRNRWNDFNGSFKNGWH